MQTNEMILPAQIGMQSFAGAMEKLRKVMAKEGYDGFIEFPMARRLWVSPSGTPLDASVFMFRVITTGQEAWDKINAVLKEGWVGRAGFQLNGRIIETADDMTQLELGL